MNDARYRYLVQRMFDEELPPEVSYAVKGYLDTSEQGSNFYMILKELLEAVEQIPLPEELKPEQPDALKHHIAECIEETPSFFRFVGRLFRRESKKTNSPPKVRATELTVLPGGKGAAQAMKGSVSSKRPDQQEDVQTITKRLRAIGRARDEAQEVENTCTSASLRQTLKMSEPEREVQEPAKTLADAIRQRMRETSQTKDLDGASGAFSTAEPLPDSWYEYAEQTEERVETDTTSQTFATMEAYYTASESFSAASVTKTLDDVFRDARVEAAPSIGEPVAEVASTVCEGPIDWQQRPRFQSPCDPSEQISEWTADYRNDMVEVAPTTIIGSVFSDEKAINDHIKWSTDGASFADTMPLAFIDVDPTIVQQPLFNAVPQDLFGADYEKALSASEHSIFQSVPENLFGPQFDRAVRKQEHCEVNERSETPRSIPVDEIMEQLGKLFVGRDSAMQPEVVSQEEPRIVPVTSRGNFAGASPAPQPAPPVEQIKPVETEQPLPLRPVEVPVVSATNKIVFDAPVIRQVARLRTTADDVDVPTGNIQSIGKFLLNDGTRERIAEMLNQGAIEGRLKVLTAEASSEINGVLKSLEEYDGVIGSVIVGYDGLMLASTLPACLDAELISAWALMSYISTSDVSGTLGYGRVYQIASRTSTGYVLLADFGQALLVTLCNNPASDALVPLMRKVMELTA